MCQISICKKRIGIDNCSETLWLRCGGLRSWSNLLWTNIVLQQSWWTSRPAWPSECWSTGSWRRLSTSIRERYVVVMCRTGRWTMNRWWMGRSKRWCRCVWNNLVRWTKILWVWDNRFMDWIWGCLQVSWSGDSVFRIGWCSMWNGRKRINL